MIAGVVSGPLSLHGVGRTEGSAVASWPGGGAWAWPPGAGELVLREKSLSDVIAVLADLRTVPAMRYTTHLPRHWPHTPRRQAAVLRQHLDLPETRVALRNGVIGIRWVDGPPMKPVATELRGALPATSRWRATRLHAPATFGAALLLDQHVALSGWDRRRAAWGWLCQRDLALEPLPAVLVLQGQILAAIAGVPAGARIGWHHYRWDWWMNEKLTEVGVGVLASIAAPAATD